MTPFALYLKFKLTLVYWEFYEYSKSRVLLKKTLSASNLRDIESMLEGGFYSSSQLSIGKLNISLIPKAFDMRRLLVTCGAY